MQQKKIPIRRCVGCGEGKPKQELVRVVRRAAGEVNLDLTGRMPGRGAYLCRDTECLRKARKARRLEKEFSQAIPDEVYDRLEKEMGGADHEQ